MINLEFYKTGDRTEQNWGDDLFAIMLKKIVFPPRITVLGS